MDARDREDLGAAAAVRMCHDLAGAAGAIANGLELLEGEPDAEMAAEVRGLLRQSAATLGARLDFFRAVFGLPTGRALKPGASAAVARAYLARLGDAQRVYELGVFPDELEGGPEVWRLALALVLIGADALPFGGRIAVEARDGMPHLHATGRRAQFSEGARAALEDGAADPHAVAGALLRQWAAALGRGVRIWQAAEACGVALEVSAV